MKCERKQQMRSIDYLTEPENAFLHNRWAAATPILVFGILYGLVQVMKLNLNMLYLLSIYAVASYSAWYWGISIKRQKEL